MLDPGSVVSVTSGDGTCSAQRLILEPQDGSELTVTSLNRAQGQPSYAGRRKSWIRMMAWYWWNEPELGGLLKEGHSRRDAIHMKKRL